MEKQSIVIRPMNSDDVPAVQKIEVVSFPDSPWTEETYVHELCNNHFAHYFVAEKNDVIVGYIGLWIVVDDAQITTIAISPESRGNGYANTLMDFIIDYCKPTVRQISLEVNVNNHHAIKLYESKGFVYGGIRKDYYGAGKDAHVMWVRLDGEKY